jgi:carbamoylphosphate synthase large subunit
MTSGERLKAALLGDTDTRFVLLGNVEVERDWAKDRPRLPGAGISFTAATVNRIEEMGWFLADPGDMLVLKRPVDPDYQAYLGDLGIAGPTVLCPENSEPARRVTEDVLASPELLADLRGLVDGRTWLLPFGVSENEQRLAEHTGLPLAAPAAAVCAAVNSKVFGRALTARAGLRQVPGTSCSTADQVEPAVQEFLRPGGRVVVKEALGVSGRGLAVFNDLARALRFSAMLGKRDPAVDLVVEQWIEKVADLNYQFVIGRDGTVTFETVKAAVVESGAHRGHRFPVSLPDAVYREIRRAAELIGADLYTHGYYGAVGVDALLAPDDVLYPCLEINARFNMANYQNAIAERLLPADAAAEACSIDLVLNAPRTFTDVVRPVRDLLLTPDGDRGVVVTNFATVNAEARGQGNFRGRLGVLCIGTDPDDAAGTRAEFAARLSASEASS